MTTTEKTVRQIEQAERARVAEFFARDTADHQLEVIRDDGLYRHLRFKKPGTGSYRYDIVTWPGYLTFCGDMGTVVFSRLEDMLAFFRDNPDRPRHRINPDYWSQKVMDDPATCRRYSAEVLRASILEHVKQAEDWYGLDEEDAVKLREQVDADILPYLRDGQEPAMEALRDFEFDSPGHHGGKLRFEEYYEFVRDEYDFRFLWALHGIVSGIEQYDAYNAALADVEAEAEVRVLALASA